MLRAAIVDQKIPDSNTLKILLEQTGQVQVVAEYTKSPEALKRISGLQPDVVFLDAEMPGINGIELARILLEQGEAVAVVFVTASRDYAVEAFEVNAVDYLLKPVLPETVCRVVSKLLKQRNVRSVARKNDGAYICCFGNAKICCFGNFDVRNSFDGSSVKWRTAKDEELFAYLLYHRNTLALATKAK
jgi:two-component SAPR family response regulator